MSKLDDLIEQIDDPGLRDKIMKEARTVEKRRRFGLVFEEHLPECTPLYDVPVKVGSVVAKRVGDASDDYIVTAINGDTAVCREKGSADDDNPVEFKLDEIVSVAQFGEPIYPYLKRIDSIENSPDSNLWHTLIEADNYHALQLLDYLYAGKVDCIYIDPPYNTGARDWKYNNDYVDSSDAYRHSKWLSFMEKRLKLAKKLLNPKSSVLIVTIDEKEFLHLGMLLEQMFPEARIQMISSVISPQGQARNKQFYRTDEYIFIVEFGDMSPAALPLSNEWFPGNVDNEKMELGWDSLKRRGTGAYRKDSPNLFYPIYVSKDGLHIIAIGDSLAANINRNTVPDKEGCKTIWPLRSDGSEGRWQLSQAKLKEKLSKGYVKLGKFDKFGSIAIYYLKRNEQNKIENGIFNVIGHNPDGSIITNVVKETQKKVCGTQWRIASHNAGVFGSNVIRDIFHDKRFTFPKSMYAVHDVIRFFVADSPNALIVDFFAGSGTTLHAVNLLNAEDGGHRRCIMVTNNEVSVEEAKALTAHGYHPGDDEWEKFGIAHYVTWPRTVCSIKGIDVNGNPLKGDYGCTTDSYAELDANVTDSSTGKAIHKKVYEKAKSQIYPEMEGMKMSDGFKANCIYFKLGFLDKDAVALGKQFKEILPILWMKAGAVGRCPEVDSEDVPPIMVLPENHMLILNAESAYSAMVKAIEDHPEISTVYIVTNSELAYRDMVSELNVEHTYQLYRDYLDNFRINTATRR